MNLGKLHREVYNLWGAMGAVVGAIIGLWDISEEIDEGVDYYREREIKSELPSDIDYALRMSKKLTEVLQRLEKEVENG